MHRSRQSKIVEIIEHNTVRTQDDLQNFLKLEGYDVTQSTISRDIKDLHISKVPCKDGGYCYSLNANQTTQTAGRLSKIFRETIRSVTPSENLIVVKTLPGCGNAAGEALDAMGLTHVIGSIAGDNTVLLVCDNKDHTGETVTQIHNLL